MRKKVHIGMAVVMGITIFVFNLLNNTSVIDAVYILASYTYGPILGLFAFGIFMKQQVRDKYIPLVAIASPGSLLHSAEKFRSLVRRLSIQLRVADFQRTVHFHRSLSVD